MPDDFAEFHVEHPGCHHMVTIKVRPQQSIADYNARLVPELRELVQQPCPECAKEKAEQIKQKLVHDMQEKVKK